MIARCGLLLAKVMRKLDYIGAILPQVIDSNQRKLTDMAPGSSFQLVAAKFVASWQTALAFPVSESERCPALASYSANVRLIRLIRVGWPLRAI